MEKNSLENYSEPQFITPAEERKQNRKELGLAALGGLMAGLAFPPLPFNFLMFFALIPLFMVIEKRESLSAVSRVTYLFALVFNIISLYWVGSWTPEADPFLKMSGIMLVFFNPIIFLIPSTVYFMARKVVGKDVALVLLPFFWVFFEYIYTVTEFRFPWLTLANSQAGFLPFIQIADIVGAYGLSLAILFINLALYLAYKNRKITYKRPLILAVSIFCLILVYGFIYNGSDETDAVKIKAGIVQPDLNPWNKWETGNLDKQLDVYLELSQKCADDSAKIIVWPETALPVYLMAERYRKQVVRIWEFVTRNNVIIVTGMPDATFYAADDTTAPLDAKPLKHSEGSYTSFNSILMFEPGYKDPAKYGKMMLVPFGEKVPYVESLPFLGDLLKWEVGISSWNVGSDTVVFRTKIDNKDINLSGVICIESIYPDFTAQFVDKGAELLTVVTNDSWYGYSSGPFQHKEFARLRAVENRRNIIRCANGGVSCFIDAGGKTYKETELFTKTWITGEVSLLKEKTFYTQTALFFPGMSVSTSVLIIILYILSFFRKKNEQNN